VSGFGSMIKFIPHPVIIGFTSGIAVIIFTSQIRDFLGLRMNALPASFTGKMAAYAHHIDSTRPGAAALAVATLAILIFWPRVSHRIPGPFVALVVTTIAAHAGGLDVETIGSRFGVIDAGFPHPVFPAISAVRVAELLRPAVTIALLAAIESLLSAVVADGMIGGKHRSNMELVAQGIANIASPLFGGIPATGAIARTATNIRNGGRTPVAGIVHAVTLLLITLFVGKWAALIPLATLAGILTIVAYDMSGWRTFAAELRAPRSDVAVLLVTFLLTIFVDLTVAIEVGMVLAAFLFMRRMAEVTNVRFITQELVERRDDFDDANSVRRRHIPGGVEVYEIDGPFFFGAAETFKETMGRTRGKPRVMIIRMRHVPAIDSTGIHVLRELTQRSKREGTLLLLSDVHAQPMFAMARADVLQMIGEENTYGNLDDALNRARSEIGVATEERPVFATPTVARETPIAGVPVVSDGSP
jgi:sulfate permease, SulP family